MSAITRLHAMNRHYSPKYEAMAFEDNEVKRICVENFGGVNGITQASYGKTGVVGIEGEVTYEQVLAVTAIDSLFTGNKTIARFNEFVYFKNLTFIGNASFQGCSNLQDVSLPYINIVGDSTFSGCISLKNINTLFGLKITKASYMFNNCTSLSSLDASGWDMGTCTNTSYMFQNCTYLSTLLGGSQDKPSALLGTKVSLSVSNSPLDKASLLAIINGLADLTGKTQQILTVGDSNKAKLTTDEIATATNKNWQIT